MIACDKKFDGIYLNSDNKWCRICPKCKMELAYKNRPVCLIRYHKNSLCRSCYQIGNKAFWYGKKRTKETKSKMSIIHLGIKLSVKTKEKLSKQKKGKNNPNYKRIPSEEYRKNMRIAALNRIKRQGTIISFNPKACEFIDNFGKKNGFDFKHALNGGEMSLSGFPVDGYDENKNVVFEYDEPYHYNKKRKEKDDYKTQCIINDIKPNIFFRYDEKNNKLYDVLTNHTFI